MTAEQDEARAALDRIAAAWAAAGWDPPPSVEIDEEGWIEAEMRR